MYLFRIKKCFNSCNIIEIVPQQEKNTNKFFPKQMTTICSSGTIGRDSCRQFLTPVVDVCLLPVQQQLHLKYSVRTCLYV